jgi:type IV secretion system protein VirD4
LAEIMNFTEKFRKPKKIMIICNATLVPSRRGQKGGYTPSSGPSISRTKPLVRLILNQIGRRLTEKRHNGARRHRVLLLLDEFPALGRLDFFESALAFVASYGLKSILITQSLNQIEKVYGPNNSILDNCHVRVAFATNDERTARRVSEALGTATELRAMKNYAGHRLSPWLAHLMVSRQETARPLLTPGEVMQFPITDELVLVSGIPPIRASKVRYYEDARFRSRILNLPVGTLPAPREGTFGDRSDLRNDDWNKFVTQREPDAAIAGGLITDPLPEEQSEADIAGVRREPTLPDHEEITREHPTPCLEFAFAEDTSDADLLENETLRQGMATMARQAAMDPADGLGL